MPRTRLDEGQELALDSAPVTGQMLIEDSEDVRLIGENMVKIEKQVRDGALSRPEGSGRLTEQWSILMHLVARWMSAPKA